MNSKLNRFLTLSLAVVCLATAVNSQTASRSRPEPFAVGETLSYEARLSKIISGIAAADLVFTIAAANDNENLILKASAKSKGTLLKLARYSFLQEIQSTVATNEFRALRTVKHDVQKERVRDSEATFDYEQRRVTYVETNPSEPMRPPRRIASDLSGAAQDLVSAVYSLRTLPLAVGRTFSVTVSDSGLVYNIPLRVTARESIKTIFGKVMCLRVEPLVFGQGRLIESEGKMVIWLTDDARFIPVRARVEASIGRIDIKLKSAKNTR